ncbi:hypothetical protein RCL_jg3486.t1 [Rhizophagus clarus]|uniref:Uncharacterized protein n=1 Tax=Rhizophagus clarus TaxID=94130 RepID=A0A8H3LZ84_9GLOM|nr:hypothetical protein RCL_jg3486.t1 [Rhizophagus clarus]
MAYISDSIRKLVNLDLELGNIKYKLDGVLSFFFINVWITNQRCFRYAVRHDLISQSEINTTESSFLDKDFKYIN